MSNIPYGNLLLVLLPLLIQLMLSNSQTTKIECLHEMATLLKVETSLAVHLADLGYSSLTSTQ
jgi:hypothetical protein